MPRPSTKTSTAKPKVSPAAVNAMAVASKACTVPAREELVLVPPPAVARARRPRVPKDFAAQYGEKGKAPRASPAVAAARRARRDAGARERMAQLMAPSDDVVRRLAQIGAIAPVVGIEGADESGTGSGEPARRGARQWEWQCGKCGATQRFTAAAGVCSRCGAIAVRP